jgi:hypothetical protein
MKRGVKTLIIGVIFLAVAVVAPFLFLLPFFLQHQNENQFKVPGSIQITVEKPGRYYLWNDFRTVYNGQSFNRSEQIPDGLNIRIADSDGHPLTFVSNTSISSTNGSNAKNSIGYVEIEHPGKVTVQVSGGAQERIFSFSRSGILMIFLLVIGGFGASVIFGLLGLGLIIWGIVKLVSKKA